MIFNRLTIAPRLAMGFGLLMALIVFIAGASIVLGQKTARSVVDLRRKTTIRREIKDVLISVNEARAATWAFVVTNDDGVIKTWEAAARDIDKHMGDLDRIVTTAASRAMMNEDRALVTVLLRKQKAIIDANNNGLSVSSAGFVKAIEELKAAAKTFDETMAAFVTRMDVTSDEAASVAEAAIAEASCLSIVLALGGVVAGAVCSWVIGRGIARPIRSMTRAMVAIASGDYATDIPGLDHRDEIGEMAKAVQTFKDNGARLRAAEAEAARQRAVSDRERAENEAARAEHERQQRMVLGAVADGLGRLSHGDLTGQLDEAFPGAYEVLRGDFNATLASLEKTLRTIIAATDKIGSGSDGIAQASDDLSKRTEQQAAGLEETAAALNQITETVKRMAAGASQAAAVVATTRGAAEASGAVVKQAVDAMERIKDSSRQIGAIIGVIDEIAFQTNLLALNAGVEAARAGDAGRGFAVVASEVRGLAQRSAEAAREIKTLISASSTEVESGVALVGRTGVALKDIIAKVSEMDALVGEISASSNEQATSLAEINIAVRQMDQVVQKNAAMVEEATAAAHALKDETKDLTAMVGQFRLGRGRDAGASSQNAVHKARAAVTVAFAR